MPVLYLGVNGVLYGLSGVVAKAAIGCSVDGKRSDRLVVLRLTPKGRQVTFQLRNNALYSMFEVAI